MGKTITAVFQCLSAISVNGFFARSLRWVLLVAFLFQRKAHIIGRFKTKREAVKARLAGEEEYFGKYR